MESQPTYSDRVYSMGEPRINLDKALRIAADDEDREFVAKFQKSHSFPHPPSLSDLPLAARWLIPK